MGSATPLEILHWHGLHSAEARVYLALLSRSSMTASELAKIAQVPRSHVYKVIEVLHERGLADILLVGRSRRYRAKPLAEFLAARADELAAHLLTIKQALQNPPPGFDLPQAEVPDSSGETQLLLNWRAAVRKIESALGQARDRVVIAVPEDGRRHSFAILAPWIARWQAADDPAPVVRLVLPKAARNEEDWESVRNISRLSIRWTNVPSRILSVAVDGVIILSSPPPLDHREQNGGRGFNLLSSERAFVEHLIRLLDAASDEAPTG